MNQDDARLSDVLLVLIASMVALVLVSREADPDIFGRIAYARDAYAQGAWTWHADPYSYTVPGGPWLDHEWGFSWIAFFTFKLGGWWAIRLLRLLLMAGTGWLCLTAVPRGPASRRLAPGLALVLAPVLALAFIGPRPQALSYLCFAWMLSCFVRSWDQGPRWMLWAVVPMPLWVNVHGGFLAGLGVAVLWTLCRLPELLRRRDRAHLMWAAAVVAWCGMSLLMQPWGWNYALRIAQSATMARPFVEEWNPPPFLGVHWVLSMVLVVIAATAVRFGWRRWPDLAVVSVLIVQTALHRRHLTFLAIAVALFAYPALAAHWTKRRSSAWANRAFTRTATAVVGLGALLVLGKVAAKMRGPMPHEPDWPAAALTFLRTQEGGGVLVDFEWAQYVIFTASPQFKVAADGRYEEVYPDSVMRQYVAWHFGFDGWSSLPDNPNTRFALVATNSTRATRLASLNATWKSLYADSTATVFAKLAQKPTP
jgi:hypothetical protein